MLIALIVVASAYGTLLAPSPAKGVATLYASPIFNLLFLLLSLSLIFCSLRRLPKVFKNIKSLSLPLSTDYYLRQKYRFVAKVSTEQKDSLFNVLNKHLRSGRSIDGKYVFYLQKGLLNQFGSYILHTGILIILAGGVIRFILLQTGYVVPNAQLIIPESQSVEWFFVPTEDKTTGSIKYKKQELGFKIRCLDFDEVKYPGSEVPESYSSTVEIEKNGMKIISVIDMNHPLRWQGFKIHQMGFEPNNDVERYLVEVRRKGSREKAVLDFTPGTPVPLTGFANNGKGQSLLWIKEARAGAQWEITRFEQQRTDGKEIAYTGRILPPLEIDSFIVSRLVPDFRIDDKGKVFSASSEFNNPAIYVIPYKGNMPMRGRWCFLRKEFQNMSIYPDEPYAFKFLDYSIGSTDERNTTVTVEVIHQPDNRVLGQFSVRLNQRQQLPAGDVYEDETESSITALSGGNPYSVRLIGRAQGYTTVLGLVREPTTPLTFIGGGIVVLGAFFIFFLRYRRIFALYDERSCNLYLTLICKNPDWWTDLEWQRLINKFSFLETNEK